MDPRVAYCEGEVRGATNPVHLVVMLYEQAARDLREAVTAMARRDVEARTRELDHALIVVGQLQGTLDLERGGEVAHNLNRYYDILRLSLLQAHVESSPQVLERQISTLMSLREAWLEVERSESQRDSLKAQPREGSKAASGEPPIGDWRA